MTHLGPTTAHAGTACPGCGRVIDASTGYDHDASPTEGDWSLCGYCGDVLRFGPGLELRRATSDELAELSRVSPETSDQLNEARGLVMRALASGRVRP